MKTYKSTVPQFKITKNKDFPSNFQKAQIRVSKDSCNYIRQFYGDDIEVYESFFILLLNRSNNTIGWAKISQGGVAGTVVDLKIVLKYSIESLASSVILAHNHPSGSTKPSQADLDITKKAKEALRLCDITLLDHIILTDSEYYSFADEGRI